MIWLMGRQKSGIFMLSLQRMLEINSHKTVWTMGHKICQPMADQDAHYKLLPARSRWTTLTSVLPNPVNGGMAPPVRPKWLCPWKLREISSDLMLRMAPRVSGEKIQALVRERLVAEAVVKTDGWQGYSVLDASPGLRHEWLVPGSGKEAPKVLPWVHTFIANIKGNIRGIHHGVSPKHLPLSGGILLPFQPPLLGTTNV
jgi:hypothetical protein